MSSRLDSILNFWKLRSVRQSKWARRLLVGIVVGATAVTGSLGILTALFKRYEIYTADHFVLGPGSFSYSDKGSAYDKQNSLAEGVVRAVIESHKEILVQYEKALYDIESKRSYLFTAQIARGYLRAISDAKGLIKFDEYTPIQKIFMKEIFTEEGQYPQLLAALETASDETYQMDDEELAHLEAWRKRNQVEIDGNEAEENQKPKEDRKKIKEGLAKKIERMEQRLKDYDDFFEEFYKKWPFVKNPHRRIYADLTEKEYEIQKIIARLVRLEQSYQQVLSKGITLTFEEQDKLKKTHYLDVLGINERFFSTPFLKSIAQRIVLRTPDQYLLKKKEALVKKYREIQMGHPMVSPVSSDALIRGKLSIYDMVGPDAPGSHLPKAACLLPKNDRHQQIILTHTQQLAELPDVTAKADTISNELILKALQQVYRTYGERFTHQGAQEIVKQLEQAIQKQLPESDVVQVDKIRFDSRTLSLDLQNAIRENKVLPQTIQYQSVRFEELSKAAKPVLENADYKYAVAYEHKVDEGNYNQLHFLLYMDHLKKADDGRALFSITVALGWGAEARANLKKQLLQASKEDYEALFKPLDDRRPITELDGMDGFIDRKSVWNSYYLGYAPTLTYQAVNQADVDLRVRNFFLKHPKKNHLVDLVFLPSSSPNQREQINKIRLPKMVPALLVATRLVPKGDLSPEERSRYESETYAIFSRDYQESVAWIEQRAANQQVERDALKQLYQEAEADPAKQTHPDTFTLLLPEQEKDTLFLRSNSEKEGVDLWLDPQTALVVTGSMKRAEKLPEAFTTQLMQLDSDEVQWLMLYDKHKLYLLQLSLDTTGLEEAYLLPGDDSKTTRTEACQAMNTYLKERAEKNLHSLMEGIDFYVDREENRSWYQKYFYRRNQQK